MKYLSKHGLFEGTPEEMKEIVKLLGNESPKQEKTPRPRGGEYNICVVDNKKFLGRNKTCSRTCFRVLTGRNTRKRSFDAQVRGDMRRGAPTKYLLPKKDEDKVPAIW